MDATRAPSAPPRLVRVAAVNDYELVVEGVASLLRPYDDRVLVADRIVIGEEVAVPVDVALYDTYGRAGAAEQALRTLAEMPNVGKIALFTMDLRQPLVAEAFRWGASAVISKALPGERIVQAIVDVARGAARSVTGHTDTTVNARHVDRHLNWPGREDGLTERESQVLVLCSEGLRNREIASELFLGTETVKTHLQRAYRKLGITSRVQAARYVHESGAFSRYQPADPTASPSEPPPAPVTS